MVGGVSRIPLIAEMLVTEVGFDEGKLNRSLSEDEAVVSGAAIYAENLLGTLQVFFIWMKHNNLNKFYNSNFEGRSKENSKLL